MHNDNKYPNVASSSSALYLHFPFCRRKCNYCSFVSYQCREADIPAYIDALKQELALRAAGKHIRTIYFGGGTPSLLSPDQFEDIISTIRSLCNVDKEAEITIEANPGTVDEPYLAAIRRIGINRISLGVQSLDDGELALLGRIHTAGEARKAVQLAQNAGFTNLNIDLIYGIPGQTLLNWKNTLAEAIKLNAEHLSLYALSLEGDEPLSLAIERGELPAVNPDLCAEHYELAEDSLAEHGYHHYEISNWAKTGYECRHNLVYWRNESYIGVGAAAHSYLDSHRFATTKDINEYLDIFLNNAQSVPDMNEEIGSELQLAEAIILGLRLSQGVNVDDIYSRFGVNLLTHYAGQVNNLTGSGLLEFAEGQIRLTRRGRLLGNEFFWQFLPA
jgi:oxygen-independent coproporphyrinogen-3 oxidase